MIELMLQHDGEQPIGLDVDGSTVEILSPERDARGAPNPLPHVRDAQATLDNRRAALLDLHGGIHHDELAAAPPRGIRDEHLHGPPDLWGRQPNPLVGVHRLDEIIRQDPKLLRKRGDRLSAPSQDLMRQPA
jgi:hypothetical protein